MATIVLNVKDCCPCKGHREKVNQVLSKIEGIERKDVNLERETITIVTAKEIDVVELVEKLTKRLKRAVTLEEPIKKDTKPNEANKGKEKDDAKEQEKSKAKGKKARKQEKGKEKDEKAKEQEGGKEQGESSNAVKDLAIDRNAAENEPKSSIIEGTSPGATSTENSDAKKKEQPVEKSNAEMEKPPVPKINHEISESSDVVDYTSNQFAPTHVGQHSNTDSCFIM